MSENSAYNLLLYSLNQIQPSTETMKKSPLLFLLFGQFAYADAVMDPPEECPIGSEGMSSHYGEWCGEVPCDEADPCPEGSECISTSVCLDVITADCGGLSDDTGEPCTFEVREVLGTCETDSDCERGTCVTANRCATDAQQEEVDAEAACSGCSQGQQAGSIAGLFGLLGWMFLSRRRA